MTAEQMLIDDAAQAELCGRVQQFLASQHFPSMRTLEVTVSGDTVILDGCIPNFHQRQMAIAYCKRVAGVHSVVDRLIVTHNPPTAGRVVRARLDSAADDQSLLAVNGQTETAMARRRPK